MITAFHGIGAYRGQRNPVALSRQLNTALSGVEICGADRPIGAFGAVIAGECRKAFDCDVWSVVRPDGQREPTSFGGWDNDCEPQTQYEWESFAQSALAYSHTRSYCEAWISGHILRAVWVKSWAPEKTKKAAAVIAKHRKVPLLTLSGADRIWSVLDENRLPFWRDAA